MVWACHKIIRTCQDNPARHSIRRKKERQTKKELGRQHLRMDRITAQEHTKRGRR